MSNEAGDHDVDVDGPLPDQVHDDSDTVPPEVDDEVRGLLTRYRRSRAATYTSLTIMVLLLIGIGLLPVPYIRLSPGPVYNTIGSADGVELITISGTQTYPTTGELDLLTVTERGGPYGGLTLPEAVLGWASSDDQVVPVGALYPPEVDGNEARTENAAAFTSSQSAAIAASLNFLKIPVTSQVIVALVVPGGPSDGKLQTGDIITAVGGKPVTKADELAPLVRTHPPGSILDLAVTRQGSSINVQVTLGASPRDPAQGFIGVQAGNSYSGPFKITFGLESVGGPSAGMMFSLGIIDKLTPAELNGGKIVAGTGTIDSAGDVGPIGGIQQKLAAARNHGAALFLAPADNCQEVNEFGTDGLNVAKVSNLNEAVQVLDRWRAGSSDLPRC